MALSIPIYQARQVVSVQPRGSSRPIIVETDAGQFLTKLRGAAQGTAALVAEIIVAHIAEALGFWVPCRALILIDETIENPAQEDEFLDLLAASTGINLGFQYLDGAVDIQADAIAAIDPAFACQVLWLDSLVMNLDRTAQNPNLMRYHDQVWLIDHGAALPFQYRWATVMEDSPRSSKYALHHHLFAAQMDALHHWDAQLTAKLSPQVLQHAVTQVPDCFLQPLLGAGASTEQIERRRQAYAAFLWKRLKAPRPFIPVIA
ncbi:hypothetical protein IQ266_11535 [filamentous cyanobacterium LEGE 11480]|uniref:HipA-like kinase domain-containing protein n=1 Tax=Romeriopsis navalis LEGE 11480 TaxID=2777977 RepID=A0A928Z4I5_9CYAN|nr:HipA family kinase [Romeriopsis navalis]MBE9030363.1 hypothetical protein [Romeriopsis navalis LEGE 11480]